MSQSLSPAADYLQQNSGNPFVVHANDATLFPRVASRSWSHAAKTLVDKNVAAVAIVCLSPLMLVLAVLIRLESGGPILFRQKRMGRDGRVFWCLKFRTMVADAETRLKDLEHLNESPGGVLFKIKRDPRITRLGGFLRKSSLDELPQLFNILRGEMSLVGPRPLQLRDCELLEQFDPHGYRLRLSRPQGLTGLWQVSGRSNTSSESMLKLDLDYVNSWSLPLDFKILLKTVRVVLTGRGAC